MKIKDCLEFARKNPTCYLATATESGEPKVRPFLCWAADSSGFYFDTADYKDTWQEINDNPKIEVCFHPQGKKEYLRISGEVDIIDTPEANSLIDKISDEDFGLGSTMSKEGGIALLSAQRPYSPNTRAFRMSHGNCIVWNRDSSGKSHREELSF